MLAGLQAIKTPALIMNIQITMIKESLQKKANKKTAYENVQTETKVITKEQHENIVNAASFMRRLGGTESHTKSYTNAGYLVTRIVSTSPDKKNKSIYTFKFDYTKN